MGQSPRGDRGRALVVLRQWGPGRHYFLPATMCDSAHRALPTRELICMCGARVFTAGSQLPCVAALWLAFSLLETLWRSDLISCGPKPSSPRGKSHCKAVLWSKSQVNKDAGHSRGLEVTSQELRAKAGLLFGEGYFFPTQYYHQNLMLVISRWWNCSDFAFVLCTILYCLTFLSVPVGYTIYLKIDKTKS